MLIPLGALALGAVFSGMLWYNVFFGEDAAVRDWFGMEEIAHAAGHGDTAEGHSTAAAPGEDTAVATEGEAAPARGTAAATEAHGDTAGHASVTAGAPPQGALVMLPFTPERQAAVETRLDAAKVAKAAHAPNTMINAAHLVPTWVKLSPFIAMLIGLGLAWLFYIRDPSIPGRLAKQQRPLYLFLLNKWHFDELYDVIFVRPAKWLGMADPGVPGAAHLRPPAAGSGPERGQERDRVQEGPERGDHRRHEGSARCPEAAERRPQCRGAG